MRSLRGSPRRAPLPTRAITVSRHQYQHDLDTGETDYRPPRKSAAELAEYFQHRNEQRDNGAAERLSPMYEAAAKFLDQQSREQKAQQRQRASRRRSASRAHEKEGGGAKLPQIVITSEPTGGGMRGF